MKILNNKKVVAILIYQFVSMIIFNMAQPVTPLLITSLGYPDYSFGLLFATMAAASFITAPYWGQLADKFGNRRVMMIGPVGSAIGQLGFGLSTTFSATLFFRVITGTVNSATILVSLLYVNRMATNENRGKLLAYSAGMSGAGGTIGYLLGGVISDGGYKITFFTQVILILLLPLLARLILDKDQVDERQRAELLTPWILLSKVRGYIKKPVGLYFIMMFLMSFGFTMYNTTIPFYLNTIWKVPPSVIGYFMTITGILGLFANLYLLTKLIQRFRPWVVLLIEAIVLSICLASLTFVHNMFFVVPIMFIYLICLPMYRPLNQMLIGKEATENQGVIFGIMNSFNSLGMILGSLVAGFAFEVWVSLPFVIATAIFFLAGMLVYYVKKIRK